MTLSTNIQSRLHSLAKAAFEAAVLKLRFKRGKSQNVLAVWEIKRQVSSGHYDKACTQG